jgi:hypothetical protein
VNARVVICAAVALLVAGCANAGTGESASVALMQTDSPIPAEAEAGLADADFVGTWSGPVSGDSEDYGMVVVFTTDGGVLRGSVEYPELTCTGKWTLTDADGSVRDFTEIIDEGGRDRCIPVTKVEVRHQGGSLSYEVTETPGWEEYPSRATLTRTDL